MKKTIKNIIFILFEHISYYAPLPIAYLFGQNIYGFLPRYPLAIPVFPMGLGHENNSISNIFFFWSH